MPDRIPGLFITGTDPEVALLVCKSLWMVMMNHYEVTDAIEPDQYEKAVRDNLKIILQALAEGKTKLDDPILQEVIDRTIQFGRTGIKPISTRDQLQDALTKLQGIS